MKKRIISLILAVLLIATILPTKVFAAQSGSIGSVKWSVSSAGTLTISGKGAIPDCDIPDFAPWTQIPGIKKIVIKDGITSIGAYAFMGYIDGDNYVYGPGGASSIEIPASVKSIDDTAFLYTYFLEKFTVSSSNKYFSADSQGALYNKDKSALLWVPGATEGTFKIPKTVTEINPISFIYDCMYLEKITVANGNTRFVSDNQGAVYYKGMEELLLVPKGYKGKFFIPEGVKKISSSAFVYCFELTEVTIPEGVTEIPEAAFFACLSLHVVTLPETLTTVGANAFGECSELFVGYYNGSKSEWEDIDIKEGNNHLVHCDWVYKGCDHPKTSSIDPASCTELQQLQCTVCDKVFDGEPALGHAEETIPGKEPTCTDKGLSDGIKCTRCGETLSEQTVVPATGHTGEWTITKEATDSESGTKERICTVCGEKEEVTYNLFSPGDVNGDNKINALDATQILRFANNKSSVLSNMEDAEKFARADVNKDNKINALDATQILRFANNKASVLNK